ncbi:MAG: hypothetical protein LBE70_03745, partial [Nitrososphaerota archaeon]|nr:hypothetical protein [Nitrososphaerota archaeon]
IFANRTYSEKHLQISTLYKQYQKNVSTLLFSSDNVSGYPVNQVMKAVTFLVAAELGLLNGLRPK